MKDCNETADCSGRREFLVKAAFLTGGLVLTLSGASTLFGRTVEDITIAIDDKSPLSHIGGSTIIDTASGKVIVLRTGEKSFAAYSARCTHKGGIVDYDPASKQFVCPKHGSRFESATGFVAEGPAKQSLSAYKTKSDGSSVIVSVQ